MTLEPTVTKIFSKYLDQKISKKIKTIDDVLNLPISAYKFLNKDEINLLGDTFKINNISDATKINRKDPVESIVSFEIKEETEESKKRKEELKNKIQELNKISPDFERNLKKLATISFIIKGIKDQSIEEKKNEQKIIVVGLDNAGKTAILSKFGGQLGINDLANLKPTKGVHRTNIKTDTLNLYLWDFGGQKKYRDQYLSNPELYFIQLDLLIYVIDVVDAEKFEDSINYFRDILNILKILEENPYILIFIHKYDPDLKNDPKVLLNIEHLKDQLKELFQGINYDLDYEMYLTSIFSLITNEPEFSKYIKNIIKANPLTDPTIKKIEGLGKILEETMNAVIRLSESISIQLNDIDSRLRAIESGAFQIAQGGVPIEIQTPSESGANLNPRSQVLKELKDLFSKKKGLDL
jgi:GTPase SAR1 family protein